MLNLKRLVVFVSLIMYTSNMLAQNSIPKDTLYGDYLGQEIGYLWVGTEDGLHKFNGYEFKVYLHDPNDSTSIKDDHIRDLHFTNDTLWAATNTKGISGFVPSKNKFFNLHLTIPNDDLDTSYRVFELTNTMQEPE